MGVDIVCLAGKHMFACLLLFLAAWTGGRGVIVEMILPVGIIKLVDEFRCGDLFVTGQTTEGRTVGLPVDKIKGGLGPLSFLYYMRS